MQSILRSALLLASALLTGSNGQESSSPSATNSVATSALTLPQCQSIARRHNRGLRVAHNNLESALLGNRVAESEVFAPTLNLSHEFTEDNDGGQARAELKYLAPLGIEVSPYVNENYDDGTGPSDTRSSNVGIVLTRRLFAVNERWRLRLPLSRAERTLLAARNSLRLRARELDFDVLRSFLAVQRVENRLRVRRARVTDAKEFLQTTVERELNGLAPKVDIVNARINLNQAEADVLNEEASLSDRTESLLNTLGRPITDRLTIVPYDVKNRPEDVFDLAGDSNDLLQRHETLVNEKLGIAFAKVEREVAKDELRPNLGLSLRAERRSEGADLLNDRIDGTDPVTLGLTFSTPLDGKKRQKARLAQLDIGLENQASELIDAENRLLLRLRAAHRSIERLRLQVGLNEQRLEAERARLEATLVRYEDGNVDNLEVTRAKQTIDNAEIALIDSLIDLVVAQEEYASLLPPATPVQTTLSKP